MSYYDKDNKKTVNLKKLHLFLAKYVSIEAMNTIMNLPFVKNNSAAISLVADGCDMWNGSVPALVEFRKNYILCYAVLPTNTQFGERGVKESGYITLGKCNESRRSILAISRGTLLPEALAVGCLEIECLEEEKKDNSKESRKQGF